MTEGPHFDKEPALPTPLGEAIDDVARDLVDNPDFRDRVRDAMDEQAALVRKSSEGGTLTPAEEARFEVLRGTIINGKQLTDDYSAPETDK